MKICFSWKKQCDVKHSIINQFIMRGRMTDIFLYKFKEFEIKSKNIFEIENIVFERYELAEKNDPIDLVASNY